MFMPCYIYNEKIICFFVQYLLIFNGFLKVQLFTLSKKALVKKDAPQAVPAGPSSGGGGEKM